MFRFPFAVLAASAALCAQNVVEFDLTAAPGTVDLGPGYTNEPAWLYNGTAPGPTIRASVGDILRVRMKNELPVNTILDFHGLPIRLGMDGVSPIARPEIAPGQEFEYEIELPLPGTFWFHPHAHHQGQVDRGLYGVLIVDPPASQPDPAFDLEHSVVLDDWSGSVTGGTFNGTILNGKISAGQQAISVQSGQMLRLRLANCSQHANYIVALDGHPMTVTHADGNRVQPFQVDAIPIGIGERYDVLVDCNNPGVWSLAVSSLLNRNQVLVRGVVRYSGQTGADPSETAVPANLSSGTLLDYSMLASFYPAAHPITATPDRTYPVEMGIQAGPLWTINNEAWPNVTPIEVSYGDIVQLDLTTTTPGPNHVHPMHLHGHFVQLMGTAGGTTHPPLKDTILIRPSGQPGDAWSAQFVADNPGRWLYHCHEIHHMMLGMMTRVDYDGDADNDGLMDAVDKEPTMANPVVMVSPNAADFMPGASGELTMQWTPNELLDVFCAADEIVGMQVPPYGELRLDTTTLVNLGATTTDANGDAQLAYTLPADAALVGLRIALQAVGSTPAGSARLSVFQTFTIN